MEKALKSPRRPVAVAYIRVSTRKQAEEGSSLEIQREAVIREAVFGGFDLAEVYADEGVSGGKGPDARPGLAAAIREVEEGRAEALIVAHSDRLARDTDLSGYVRTRVKQAGGRVIVIGEAKDDPMRRAIDVMLAEIERIRGSQRMKSFLAARKAKGFLPGPAPFGMRTDEEGHLEPDPTVAPVVARILRMRGQGASLRGIAATLNAGRVPGPTSSPWNAETVRGVVKRGGSKP